MTFADLLRMAGPPLIGLIIGFVASALKGRGDTMREQLRTDAELLALLPAGSDAREALAAVIDSNAKALENAHKDSRDLLGMAVGAGGMVAFGFLARLFWGLDHWTGQSLAVVCALVVAFCLVGFLDSAIPKPRVKKSKPAQE